MRLRLKRTTFVLLSSVCSFAASAAHAATANAPSLATVYHPSTLASLLDLSFGTVVSDGTGGIVNLNVADGSRSCPSGMMCAGSYALSTLYITGSDALVQVTYDPVTQLSGPGTPMNAVLQFPGGSGALVAVTGGAATIQFGATLTVNPNQLEGSYSGLFTVHVNYP